MKLYVGDNANHQAGGILSLLPRIVGTTFTVAGTFFGSSQSKVLNPKVETRWSTAVALHFSRILDGWNRHERVGSVAYSPVFPKTELQTDAKL